MKIHRLGFLLLIITICCYSPWGWSQNQDTASDGPSSFDLGVKTGSFLPYGIEGVRDLLPIWGIKMGHDVSRTLSLEYDLDIANAKGVQYFLAYISLRHDFAVGRVLPLFFTLGLDAHYYKRRDTYGEITGDRTEYPHRFVAGWHLGFGTETAIYRDLFFRTDFRMGFSPGRQLLVTIGGVYRF
jgi:hypothetical protein